MTEVRETKLPGVGVRYEFTAEDGRDVGVIVRHDGRREVIAYDAEDPDACRSLLSLAEGDTNTLAELLGVNNVTETVAEIRQEIEGLAIEWIELGTSSAVINGSIGKGAFRSRTGASIVAIMRQGDAIPAPEADFVLAASDVVVAVGTADGLKSLRTLLES